MHLPLIPIGVQQWFVITVMLSTLMSPFAFVAGAIHTLLEHRV